MTLAPAKSPPPRLARAIVQRALMKYPRIDVRIWPTPSVGSIWLPRKLSRHDRTQAMRSASKALARTGYFPFLTLARFDRSHLVHTPSIAEPLD
jgi:hypothetical protein